MSEKEQIIKLLDLVPSYKIRYILAYVQGITADEAADDEFCDQLYSKYLNDPDRGSGILLEDLAANLGIAL